MVPQESDKSLAPEPPGGCAHGRNALTDKGLMEQYVCIQDQLYGYIVSILPNWADADEVFQETSLILWEKRESFDPSQSFLAWAYGIARNVALNFIRKKQNRSTHVSPELFVQIEEARLRVGDVLHGQADALHRCLGRLSTQQRDFVMRCYSSGSPLNHIAQQMELSENAVYLRLSRLRRRLLDCISRTLRLEEAE